VSLSVREDEAGIDGTILNLTTDLHWRTEAPCAFRIQRARATKYGPPTGRSRTSLKAPQRRSASGLTPPGPPAIGPAASFVCREPPSDKKKKKTKSKKQ